MPERLECKVVRNYKKALYKSTYLFTVNIQF